jgi:hypothetical protein
MKHILAIILLTLNISFVQAEDDKTSIYKMWSRGEGIKNFVFDIGPDSVSFKFSEKDKWSASNIKNYGLISFTEKENNGRLILRRDSFGIEHYRVVDIMNLTYDSLKLFLHPEYFADKEQATGAVAKKLSEFQTFFTTEYLYLKKVEEKTTTLKKNDYISFLKVAQAEAKKRAAAKTLDLDPKKPIDKRVEEFLFAFSKEKQFRGKIFQSTLDKAMKANAKDENIKKILSSIKTNFVAKKGTEIAETNKAKGKVASDKTTSKTEPKTDSKSQIKKDKASNDLIIKTEDKKGK